MSRGSAASRSGSAPSAAATASCSTSPATRSPASAARRGCAGRARSAARRRSPASTAACRSTARRSRRSSPDVVRPVRAFVRDIEANLAAGPRPVVHGRRRHGQDDARDARLQGGDRRRPLRRDLLGAAPAGRDPRHLRPRPRRALLHGLLQPPRGRRPAAPRGPRHREAAPTGCWSSSTRWSTSATSSSARSWSRRTSRAGRSRSRSAQRTVSRIVEMCGDPLPLFGEDRRIAWDPGARRRRADPTPPLDSSRYARTRRRGRPVGRRRKGEGHRPARRAGRPRDPLPGRQQRRPHDRPRRRGVQVPPDPVGHPLSRARPARSATAS